MCAFEVYGSISGAEVYSQAEEEPGFQAGSQRTTEVANSTEHRQSFTTLPFPSH